MFSTIDMEDIVAPPRQRKKLELTQAASVGA
jgi:hypothetical protein